MNKPKVEHEYVFVAPNHDGLYPLRFTRHSDESATILSQEIIDGVPQSFVCGYEKRHGGWRKAIEDLRAKGYLELREAQDSGLIAKDWQPPEATS